MKEHLIVGQGKVMENVFIENKKNRKKEKIGEWKESDKGGREVNGAT